MTGSDPRGSASSRAPAARQRGATAIEFALVFLPFFLILYGIVTYGLIFTVEQGMTSVAGQAARSAIAAYAQVPGDTPPDEVNGIVETAVLETVMGLKEDMLSLIPAGGLQPPTVGVDACAESPRGCITVNLNYNYAANPIIPTIGLIPVPETLAANAVMAL